MSATTPAPAGDEVTRHHTSLDGQTMSKAEDSSTDLSEKNASPNQAAVEEPMKAPSNSPPPIPDGGLLAWLQVLGGFMILFNTFGILNTFGVFQTYYESGSLFQETSSNISWIGSVQSYFVLLGGVISGPVYDRGYLRTLLIVGSFGIVFGFMMLSLCHEFWQVILAQGFCIGLGAGMIFTPGLAVLPTYFTKKIGLAFGLAAAGSSFGGIIYPIVFFRLLGQIGFGWSVRVLGFIALATSMVPIIFLKMRFKPAKARAYFDLTAFKDPEYLLFIFATMIGFIGLYTMLFYLSYYGAAKGITDANMSFYLVPILNAGSMFGRTFPNWLSDKVGSLNLIAPGALVCGILNLCMIAVHNLGGIVTIAVFFGFFSGVFIALPPVIMVMLTKDKSKIGTRIGQGFAIIGLGTLAGGPGSGAVLQRGDGLHFTEMWIYAGITNIGAACLFLALRIYRTGPKLMAKT